MPEPKPQYEFDNADSDSLVLSDIRELLYIRACLTGPRSKGSSCAGCGRSDA